jgi:3-oxoacyl-[acyl-carrier protein] reductase
VGLGFAVAQRMLASGGTVTLWDINPEALAKAKEALGAGVHTVAVDVSSHASVVEAVKQTVAYNPAIDALVNSAGITGPNVKLWDYPPEQWMQVQQVNLNGLFFCCREVVPHMRARNYGRIVNIASVAGKDGNPNASAYSASKAGVIALTKSLAKEVAKSEIRINCVTPAAVRTPIFDQITQEHIDFMLSKIPLGRLGQPEEIAAMIAWLCSEECSFSTGAAFDLSGGRSTY